MTAYSETELYNCHLLSEANDCFEQAEISAETLQKIKAAHPCKLYSPQFFVAVGLGLVTIVAVLFGGLLFGLMSSGSITVVCIIMVVICYIILESMVKNRKYFNAGVDNILMIAVLSFVGGNFLSFDHDPSWMLFHSTLMIVALWLCLRFVDSFMAIVSCGFFLALSFLLIMEAGKAGFIYFPFVLMAIIGGLYFIVQKLKSNIKFTYEKCLTALTVFLLIAFYAAGNYWIVGTLQSPATNGDKPIAFGTIFWIFTVIMPVVYIAFGVAKKDLIHIRTGILLVAIAILTYKFYFTIIPVEVEMLIAGIVMIGLSYFLIKWLSTSRHGFTSEATSSRPDWKNVEALIIAETMSGTETATENNLMSGGSGGGGGAGGDF